MHAPADARPELLPAPAPATRRAQLALAGFFVVAAAHAWATKALDGRDFGVLLAAGQRALHAEELYRLSDGHWCFKYSPPAALLFAPVSLLPRRVASLLLALGSAGALVAIFRWAAGHVGAQDRPLTHVAVVALSLPYTIHLLALGQNDALLVALVVASEVTACRRPVFSGALLALAFLFKPPLLIVLVVPLAWREGRRLLACAVGLAAASGATSLRYGLFGLAVEMRGWRALLAATTPPLLCDQQNQSLWAVVCTYLARPEDGARYRTAVVLAGIVLLAAVGCLVLAASREPRRRRFTWVAAALYAAALLSPLGWRTNLLAAIPLLYLLVENARRATSRAVRRLSWSTVGVVLAVQFASYDVVGRRAFFFLLAHRHYAFACLAAALVALLGAAIEAQHPSTPSSMPSGATQVLPPDLAGPVTRA